MHAFIHKQLISATTKVFSIKIHVLLIMSMSSLSTLQVMEWARKLSSDDWWLMTRVTRNRPSIRASPIPAVIEKTWGTHWKKVTFFPFLYTAWCWCGSEDAQLLVLLHHINILDRNKCCRHLILRLITISPVVLTFTRSRWFLPDHATKNKKNTSALHSSSCPSPIHPTTAESSDYFCRWHDSELCWKSEVYKMNRNGDSTVPCRVHVPHITKSDRAPPSLTHCSLSVG